MNYGYDPTPFDNELAEKIAQYLETFPADSNDMKCYVEMNNLYQGVRIRRITHYSEELQREMVKNCDQIYAELESEFQKV